MKKTLFILAIVTSGHLCAQEDKGAIDEVTVKLKDDGVTVSSVLTDKKYLPVHPSAAFRDIIKQHAPVGKISIAPDDEPGQKTAVWVTVTDELSKPISGALVYVYQTDSRGWYSADRPHVEGNEGDRRHARLFGYVRTGADGKFELMTVKPSGYPNSDLPAHIHIEVEAKGYENRISELLFDDDPRLEGERRKRSIQEGFEVAKPGPGKPPAQQQFIYFLRLHGNPG